jgi:transposase
MVGEMRDAETAGIACQAAMTGHLVFSTLHTNDAISALTRLADLGVEPYMVAATVEGVLAQRLVRPAHTKRWKEVTHGVPIKTDAKDAAGITDLTPQGHFVRFPFLGAPYAELRSLVSARARLMVLRRGQLTRLRDLLHVVFPEFEARIGRLTKPTPRALLAAWPGRDALLAARPQQVLRVLRRTSHGHVGREWYDALCASARDTVAIPALRDVGQREIQLWLTQYELAETQRAAIEQQMVARLASLPEAAALGTIPGLGPVTAAVFLGAIGDPQAYRSAREVLKVAGLSLVEHSSGIRQGRRRISKRGRPGLRAAAYMFAVRSIRQQGIFRARYERLTSRPGATPMKAVVALSRAAIRLWFSVARRRTAFRRTLV